MPIKKFKLGELSAERELNILGQIYEKQPVDAWNIEVTYHSDQLMDIISDLRSYGLIKYVKDTNMYVMTKKGTTFYEKQKENENDR